MKAIEKEILPVIFWAHFRSSKGESDRIARFNEGKESHLIFEWVNEQRKELEKVNGVNYCVTNLKVIK
jgi:hypothetical protein